MDYQQVRIMAEEAIAKVDDLLKREVGGDRDPLFWCELESITFDQSLCLPEDDHDDTRAEIAFKWGDSMGEKDGCVAIYDEAVISPDFLAGMVYAKILYEEKFL